MSEPNDPFDIDSGGADEPPNPFDPARLRLSHRAIQGPDVHKKIVTVPVRKPTRQEFVQVHSGEDYRLETQVLEFKEERETYLVERDLWPELPGETVSKVLYTTITRQGVVLLWPIRLPGEDGRLDEWNRSALEAAELGQSNWVRLAANMNLGAYEIFEAKAKLPDPVWPDVTFEELLKIAFKSRYIKNLDHAVLQRLRGEI